MSLRNPFRPSENTEKPAENTEAKKPSVETLEKKPEQKSEQKSEQKPEEKKPEKPFVSALEGCTKEIPKQPIKDKDARESFRNQEYKTVEATKDFTAYRVFGGNAKKQGAFLSPKLPVDRMDSRLGLALGPQWWNTRDKYCEVKVPKGTVFNVGIAEKQRTPEGYILPGGEEQLLMPPEFVANPQNYGETKSLGFYTNYVKFEQRLNRLKEQ